MALLLEPTWHVTEDGARSGLENMARDLEALEKMNAGLDLQPRIRFFRWDKPTVSYGYLMSMDNSPWSIDSVKRPTGGGAVLHQTTDQSLSILWPRGSGLLPDKPRAAYQAIHEWLMTKIGVKGLTLHVSCGGAPKKGFSVCFDEPVCNDLMLGEKKMVGGALRIMRNAILYQGNILNGTFQR